MVMTAATEKGEATRQRLMDAAVAEFAEHGIAGARVDRIATAAKSNKAQLYAYFTSKELLFDAVFEASLDSIVDVVPIDPDDLGDWAVRLYDEYLVRPELIRLATWQRLERRPAGHLVDDAEARRRESGKLDGIAAAQVSGRIAVEAEPFDVMGMVISMSMTWSPVSNVFAATADEAAATHERRRAFLRAAVGRAFPRA